MRLRVVLLILWSSSVAGQSSDGPYVFYTRDSILVCTPDYTIAKKISEGNGLLLTVDIADHPNWTFQVKLKKHIDVEPALSAGSAKMFVISDIEGEFEAFRNMLTGNHVIDEQSRWTFGNGIVVIVGDLFDRGKEVAAELWLLYKLEEEARDAGGAVHVLLGNHDIMNLSGDFRYVDKKYFEDARKMGVEYKDLYSANTELGRWLRSKNIVERIGERLFTHGGISPFVNQRQWSAGKIDSVCRPYYDDKKARPYELDIFFNEYSPFWYRGYFDNPRATSRTIDSTLRLFHCEQVVVGHTIVNTNPALYHRGHVLGLDVNEHAGDHAAVVIEDDKIFSVNEEGARRRLRYRPGNDQPDNGESR